MRVAIHVVIVTEALAWLFALAPLASATPYWGPDDVQNRTQSIPKTPEARTIPNTPTGARTTSYADEFAREAAFLNTWQVHTAGADFGGIIEGEALQSIIQTDNTSEAIWVWSRYFEVTGDNQYHQNIIDAFSYSLNHPAYNEEGGSTPNLGYYRMYNCGWAMRAEQKYRDVYHDPTFKPYGDSCASYVRYHTLSHSGSVFYDSLNTAVLSWAVGNLYNAGIHENRPEWRTAAFAQARDKVKVWVEQGPHVLGNQTWAMSGGATMWGLLSSYFAEVPDSTETWVPRYKGYMDVFSDPGDFTNAWDGWYAYGHRAVGLALRDPAELAMHINLTDYLVAEDGDSDGGIPAKPQDTDQMDQTWVSNYMVAFGLSDAFGPTSDMADSHRPPATPPELVASPNPFSGTARLKLDLRTPGNASIAIHDVAGRRVGLISLGPRPAGPQTVVWNATGLPAGPYFAILRTQDGETVRRLLMLR